MNIKLIEDSIIKLDNNKIIKDIYIKKTEDKNKYIFISIRNKYDNFLGNEKIEITYHSKNDRLRILSKNTIYYDNNKILSLFVFAYNNKDKIKQIIKDNL